MMDPICRCERGTCPLCSECIKRTLYFGNPDGRKVMSLRRVFFNGAAINQPRNPGTTSAFTGHSAQRGLGLLQMSSVINAVFLLSRVLAACVNNSLITGRPRVIKVQRNLEESESTNCDAKMRRQLFCIIFSSIFVYARNNTRARSANKKLPRKDWDALDFWAVKFLRGQWFVRTKSWCENGLVVIFSWDITNLIFRIIIEIKLKITRWISKLE